MAIVYFIQDRGRIMIYNSAECRIKVASPAAGIVTSAEPTGVAWNLKQRPLRRQNLWPTPSHLNQWISRRNRRLSKTQQTRIAAGEITAGALCEKFSPVAAAG